MSIQHVIIIIVALQQLAFHQHYIVMIVMIIFIMETNKATQKLLLYETMSEQMVLQRGNSWAAIQQRC
jgi:hypothetical protein